LSPEPFQPRVDHTLVPEPGALLFGFCDGRLALVGLDLPEFERLRPALAGDPFYLGTLEGRDCFVAALDPAAELAEMELFGLRELFGRLPDHLMALAGRASQTLEWSLAHVYCGRCGTRTDPAPAELARLCPSCGALHFPRITPAVIMRVERGDKILLARNRNFRGPFHSVLAGFVEPGETLEQAVVREVREEVGVEVGDVGYFGSQAWPFPSQLMIGFTARWLSGEIVVEQAEILEAGWFGPDELPEHLPGPFSIARRLIEDFKASRSGGPAA
jgi:NAD+ diphosphatase